MYRVDGYRDKGSEADAGAAGIYEDRQNNGAGSFMADEAGADGAERELPERGRGHIGLGTDGWLDHSAFSGLVTGTIAAGAARGCIPPTRRGIRRFRGEFAFVLRPSVPRAKRSRCRAPWRQGTRRPAARHLRGALPASIRSRLTGDRGCRPLPCSLPIRSPSGRRVVGIAKGGTSRQLSRAATRGTLRNQAADVSSASPLHPDPSSFRGRQWGSESGRVQSLSRRQPLIGTGTGGLRGHRNTVQPPRCSCLPRPRRVLPAPRCLIGDRHVVGARHPYGVRAVGGPLGARPDRAADMSSASP